MQVEELLTGAHGGLFALGLFTGMTMGFKFCEKVLVGKYVEDIKGLKDIVVKQEQECMFRLDAIKKDAISQVSSLKDAYELGNQEHKEHIAKLEKRIDKVEEERESLLQLMKKFNIT